jgi:hypothetical protein
MVCAVVLLVFAVPCAVATPFLYPPETYASPGSWQTKFPYQRNAFMGFETDPHTWPSDPANQDAHDLQPGNPPTGTHYELEGTRDAELYGSDWLMITGPFEWAATDPYLGSSRVGILVFNNLNGNSRWTWCSHGVWITRPRIWR